MILPAILSLLAGQWKMPQQVTAISPHMHLKVEAWHQLSGPINGNPIRTLTMRSTKPGEEKVLWNSVGMLMATHLWIDPAGNVWEVRRRGGRNFRVDGIYVMDRKGEAIASWPSNMTPSFETKDGMLNPYFLSTSYLLIDEATLVRKKDWIILTVPDMEGRTQIYKIKKHTSGVYQDAGFAFLKDGKPLKNRTKH